MTVEEDDKVLKEGIALCAHVEVAVTPWPMSWLVADVEVALREAVDGRKRLGVIGARMYQ